MNLEFDREAYLDHLTQGTERLAGGGTGLGLGRHTAELLQEALYPMGQKKPSYAEEEDGVEHESSRFKKKVAWEMSEEEMEKELAGEDDDRELSGMDPRGNVLKTRMRSRLETEGDDGPIWNSHVHVQMSPDDWRGPCACMTGLANLHRVRNLRELLLTMGSAIRLASTLVKSHLLDPPPSPLRVYPPNSRPCPCSVMSPSMWRIFQAWATQENLGYDLTTHPAELANAEGYVKRVHQNFRSFIIGSERGRRMIAAHADYFARNVDLLEKMDSEPHSGPVPREQLKIKRARDRQQLAEQYAPKKKSGEHRRSSLDVESDRALEFETRRIREKAARLRS